MDKLSFTSMAGNKMNLQSQMLQRTVQTDFYRSDAFEKSADISLLLINDGQDLVRMNFDIILQKVQNETPLSPLLVAAIHCGPDRLNEYGTAFSADYLGRGAKAEAYTHFIVKELLPAITTSVPDNRIREIAFAGFSLGGLSAFDIAWNHPDIFARTGAFSGSFWWRSLNQDDKEYLQGEHRLMHQQVRNATFVPHMKFFFQCGEQDETNDRNKNSVIDSIDDTIDLIRELVRKGYREGTDIKYLQVADGRHDTATWARVLPAFLRWGWAQQR